jgi:hypothetical protein
MVRGKECERIHILYGSRWLLHNVYSRVLEDILPYHFLAKEGEEISVEKRM